MPRDEVGFVRFIAARYHALRGLNAVALGIAGLSAAPLLTREWTTSTAVTAGLILAGLVGAALLIRRYYEDHLGRAQPTAGEKRHPWYAGITLIILENLGRRFELQSTSSAFLALGLASALGFQAAKDWRYRKHGVLVPLVLAYIGLDRFTAHAGMEPWTWFQRSALVLASALIAQGIADHLFLANALDPATRRLAASGLPMPMAIGPSSAAAADPVAATILTALTACESADVRFLGNLGGLHPGEATGRLQSLRDAGLIFLEEGGRASRRMSVVRLTLEGRDVAANLWPVEPVIRAASPSPRAESPYFKV